MDLGRKYFVLKCTENLSKLALRNRNNQKKDKGFQKYGKNTVKWKNIGTDKRTSQKNEGKV